MPKVDVNQTAKYLKNQINEIETQIKDLEKLKTNHYKALKIIKPSTTKRKRKISTKRNKTRQLTISDKIIDLLQNNSEGLTRKELIRDINKKWKRDVNPSSLDTQLNKLKNNNHIVNFNKKWILL